MSEVRVSPAFLQRVPGIADGVRGIVWNHLAHASFFETLEALPEKTRKSSSVNIVFICGLTRSVPPDRTRDYGPHV